MAFLIRPLLLLQCLVLLFFIFDLPNLSSSQSDSPENIETFYPFPLPTPPPSPSPPPVPSSPTSPRSSPPLIPTNPRSLPPALPPQPVPASSNDNKTIAKAVAATAASTLVVATLFFFLVRKYSRRRRREKEGTTSPHGGGQFVVTRNEFEGVEGNLKGLIVDENGLDVLYWKKLEEGYNKNDFQKTILNGQKDGGGGEEEERKPERIQEIPLLRGKSSTPYNKVRPTEDDSIQNRPEPSDQRARVSLHAVGKRDSSIQPPNPPPPPAPAPPPQPRLPPSPLPMQNTKNPAPPPPPLPIQNKKNPAPPPPPLPIQNKNNPAPPPAPPPPIPAKKNPAPPPPPPRAGGAANSSLKPSAASNPGESGNGQVKLKPLHWDKVNVAEHSMVWDKIDGSFRFDGDLMEALFGYVANNRKSPPKTRINNSNDPSPSAQITILDARKSQNVAIVLRSLTISRKELLNSLNEGHNLDAEIMEKLMSIAPTEEEQSRFLEFDGDPTRLADAESFLYHLLKAIPSAFTRLNAMLFRSNYGFEIQQLKESLQTLELACNELRTRGLFMKLLEAVLKAGNRMNAGTARGNAQAFKLTSLGKLADVKSIDGKTTLLHFVVEEVVRYEGKRCVINRNGSLSRSSSRSSSSSMSMNSEKSTGKEEREREYIMLGLPVVGGLSSEFSNVKKAAALVYDTLAGTCSALTARAAGIRELVSQCGTNGKGRFVKEMEGFLYEAEEELEELRDEQKRVMDVVRRTTEYYQAGASRDKGANPLQLFVIVKNFLGMVDQVCVEIARNLQKRKSSPASSHGSNLRQPRTPVRFPNLPEHFMRGKSSSSSSDSDAES